MQSVATQKLHSYTIYIDPAEASAWHTHSVQNTEKKLKSLSKRLKSIFFEIYFSFIIAIFFHFVRFHEKKIPKNVCIQKVCIQKVRKQLTATYGARMRGSDFKIDFSWFSGEFESIKTSPGFAQLLGEN